MPYWVKRIVLGSGEVVTEDELQNNENRSNDIPPAIGDRLTVTCRGRIFEAKVIGGPNKEWLAMEPTSVVPLRVCELINGVPAKPKWMKLGERTIRFIDE